MIAEVTQNPYGRLTPAQRAALDTARNVILRAGAGSGKTTVLANRYLWLLERGVPARPGGPPIALDVDRILTLTFTRKAAEEMRHRIGRDIGRRLVAARGGKEAERWRNARLKLDIAPIGTIHAFCRQTLEEFSLSGGLDPSFDLAEDLEDSLLRQEAIEQAFEGFQSEHAEELSLLARFWSRAQAEDAVTSMLAVAEGLAPVFDALPQPSGDGLVDAWYQEATEEARRLEELSRPGGEAERAARAFLHAIGPHVAALEQGNSRAPALVAALEALLESGADKPPNIVRLTQHASAAAQAGLTGKYTLYQRTSFVVGRSGEIPKAAQEAGWSAYQALGPILNDLKSAADALPGPGDILMAGPTYLLWRIAREAHRLYRERLRHRHLLTQDDLLRETLRLLREHGEVLGVLRGRFRQILVDEFQDTDGLQWEIIRLLASSELNGEERLEPAKLFIVGDEKQSIYRFRGADVSVFAAARNLIATDRAGLADAEPIVPPAGDANAAPVAAKSEHSLAENFRSLPGILDFANSLFGQLFVGGAQGAPPYEAAPQSLDFPRALEGQFEIPDGPAVSLLLYPPKRRKSSASSDDEQTDPNAADHRPPLGREESVALAVARALGKGKEPALQVRDPDTNAWRSARPGDVMILLRMRSRLASLERRLQMLGIPFIVEKGLGFYERQEIRDVRNLLAFLSDPRDDIALFGILRAPYFSVTDQTLAAIGVLDRPTWRGRLERAVELLDGTEEFAREWRAAVPPADRERLHEAQMRLEEWFALAPRLPVAELIQLAWEQTGALATLDAQERANFDKLLAMARDYERHGYGSLGGFLRRMIEAEEDAGVREGTAEVATDEEAVRVMTIHASKGLEAPIIVLGDVDAKGGNRSDAVVRLTEYDPATRAPTTRLALVEPASLREHELLGAEAFRRRWAIAEAVKRREIAESKRLFYVACTRARDRLVIVAPASKAAESEQNWGNLLFREIEAAQERRFPNSGKPEDFWAETLGRETFWRPPDATESAGGGGGDAKLLDLIEVWSGPRLRDEVQRAERERPRELPVDAWLQSEPSGTAERDLEFEEAELLPRAREDGARFTLSPSRAGLLERCPVCFYRRYFLGSPDLPGPTVRKPVRRLRAAEYGSLVHRAFLEGIDTEEACLELARREAAGFGLFLRDSAAKKEIEAVAGRMWEDLKRFRASDLAARLPGGSGAGGRAYRERSFTFNAGNLIFRGAIDLLLGEPDGSWRLIDFKTDDIPPSEDLETHARRKGYQTQLDIYALALRRELAMRRPEALPPIECCLYFTGRGETFPWFFSAEREAELETSIRDWERYFANGFRSARSGVDCPECSRNSEEGK